MSGQTSVAFEQQSSGVVESESLILTQEALDTNAVAPVASFLEKHGHKLIAGHDGEAVTVEYAYYNCDPFRRLADAIGEAALGATAPKLPEEKEEDETEETEVKEETKDKTNRKEEGTKSEQKPNNRQPDEVIVSEKETQETKQPQAQEAPKQEATPPSNLPTEAEATDSNSSTSSSSSPHDVVTKPQPEKVTAPEPIQELSTVASGVPEKLLETREVNGSTIEPRSSEAVNITSTEASSLSPPKIEATIQPLNAGEVPALTDVKATVRQEAKTDDVLPIADQDYEIQLVDEEYQIPAPETETSYVDNAAENELPKDSELIPVIPSDELLQAPENLVEIGVQEEQSAEDFIPPITKTQPFDLSEYSQESPEIMSELSAPIEESEQTILQVAERIEEIEAKEAETAHQLLDEIIRKVAETRVRVESDAGNQEIALKAEDVEEELKELFILLFDRAEIEYTPELIESCVKLALKGDMSELIAKIEQDDEEINVPHDRGTHEVIKQLLAAISSIKKTVWYAYHIGKSALRLYSQQLATT